MVAGPCLFVGLQFHTSGSLGTCPRSLHDGRGNRSRGSYNRIRGSGKCFGCKNYPCHYGNHVSTFAGDRARGNARNTDAYGQASNPQPGSPGHHSNEHCSAENQTYSYDNPDNPTSSNCPTDPHCCSLCRRWFLWAFGRQCPHATERVVDRVIQAAAWTEGTGTSSTDSNV